MDMHAPQNPLESDDTFQDIMQHSHQPSAPQPPTQINPALQDLDKKRWKAGELSHRDICRAEVCHRAGCPRPQGWQYQQLIKQERLSLTKYEQFAIM